jgi:hypothetical protein
MWCSCAAKRGAKLVDGGVVLSTNEGHKTSRGGVAIMRAKQNYTYQLPQTWWAVVREIWIETIRDQSQEKVVLWSGEEEWKATSV